MPVHFYIPDQEQAWDRLDQELMASRSCLSAEAIAALRASGRLQVHAMATDEAEFGYLVLLVVNSGPAPWLTVFWCEAKPSRSLRELKDWLWYAARYLEWVAQRLECSEVRISVAQDHPSRRWMERLREVGFAPRQIELGLPVTEQEASWVA